MVCRTQWGGHNGFTDVMGQTQWFVGHSGADAMLSTRVVKLTCTVLRTVQLNVGKNLASLAISLYIAHSNNDSSCKNWKIHNF